MTDIRYRNLRNTLIFALLSIFATLQHFYYSDENTGLIYVPIWLCGILAALFLWQMQGLRDWLFQSPVCCFALPSFILLAAAFWGDARFRGNAGFPWEWFHFHVVYTEEPVPFRPLFGYLSEFLFGFTAACALIFLVRTIVRRDWRSFLPCWQCAPAMIFPWAVGLLESLFPVNTGKQWMYDWNTLTLHRDFPTATAQYLWFLPLFLTAFAVFLLLIKRMHAYPWILLMFWPMVLIADKPWFLSQTPGFTNRVVLPMIAYVDTYASTGGALARYQFYLWLGLLAAVVVQSFRCRLHQRKGVHENGILF